MSRSVLRLLLVAACSWALSAAASWAGEPTPGVYALKADTGRYLARCNGCVTSSVSPDSASVDAATSSDTLAKWSLSKRPSGRWVLQMDTGRFLARCTNCGAGAYPDSAFVHVESPDSQYAQWSISQRPNGKWVLQSDSGRYLARCNGCFGGGTHLDMAFVHETNPDAPWAQWTLEPAEIVAAPVAGGSTTPITPTIISTNTTPAPPGKLTETGPHPNIGKIETAIKALGSATRETFPVSTVPSAGDFEINRPDDHINGMVQFGDYWITNYPGDRSSSREHGRIITWDQSQDKYVATTFDAEGNWPASMAMMDDKILAVSYVGSKIRFFDFSAGVGSIKELTPWSDPAGNVEMKQISVARNTDQGVYYMLVHTKLWRGRYGKWEPVGEVDFDYSAGREMNSLIYLGYNTFAVFVPGAGQGDNDKFAYTIFSVDGFGKPTVKSGSQNVSVTLKNPGGTGNDISPNFRFAGAVNYNGNTFRLCASPRRLDGVAKFYCWTSPVSTATYTVKITTSSETGAGTDSNIYLTLSGPNGTTMETRLNEWISGNAFESGNTDTATITTANVGVPTGATLRSDGFFAASDWRPQSVEIYLDGSTKLASPSTWLNRGKMYLQLLTKRTHAVKIKTGTVTGAGTDANIYLTINGVETRLNDLISGNAFENGNLNSANIVQADASDSPVRMIRVRSDGKYAGADWYLEYIDVDGGRFNCSCWLNGATSKNLFR